MALCATLSTSQLKSCGNTIGGNNRLWLADYSKIVSYTAPSPASADFDYEDIDFGQIAITAISLANPAVATTATAHGLNSGDMVLLYGTTSTDGVVGTHEVNVLTATTFEIVGLDTSGAAAYVSGVSLFSPGAGWYEVELYTDILSDSSPLTIGTGVRFYEPTVTFTYISDTKAARDFFTSVDKIKTVALVRSNNGQFKLHGVQNGLEVLATGDSTFSSGPTRTDAAGFTLTLKGAETEKFYLLDPAYSIPAVGV